MTAQFIRVAQRAFCYAVVAFIFHATVHASGGVLHVPRDHETIQAAIDAAQDGDEIIVAPGTYDEAIDFLGKAIHLRSSDGRDVTTISAATLEAPVTVVTFQSGEGRDSIIEGFTITGGNGTLDGDFLYGGGVYVTGSGPTIQGCLITSNSASIGGGLYILNGSSPLIQDCEIVSNMAILNGGAAWIGGGSMAHLLNCLLEANWTGSGGGLVISSNGGSSSVLVEQCGFHSNMFHPHASIGSALLVEGNAAAVLIGSTFSGNGTGSGHSAVYVSGAIHPDSHAQVEVIDCLFESNHGNAIASNGHLLVTGSSFVGNQGSAVVLGMNAGDGELPALLVDCHFEGNIASAIRLSTLARATITGCTFIGNSSTNIFGGAINHNGLGQVVIDDSVFIGNSAPNGSGGAVRIGNGVISNSIFRENIAAHGGAILMSGSIHNCIIEDNTAAVQGGGIFGGNITVTDSQIINNNSGGTGGGIFLAAQSFTVINSTIASNTAASGGGAARNNGTLAFEDTFFCDNTPDHVAGEWVNLGGNTFNAHCTVAGDLTGDGAVGTTDLLILLAAWGPCEECAACPADLTGDCNVGVPDLLVLLQHWG